MNRRERSEALQRVYAAFLKEFPTIRPGSNSEADDWYEALSAGFDAALDLPADAWGNVMTTLDGNVLDMELNRDYASAKAAADTQNKRAAEVYGRADRKPPMRWRVAKITLEPDDG